jgi:hypothetical protein
MNAKYTLCSLILILAANSSQAIAENTVVRLPLTAQEAINLGLDPRDPLLFRLLQTRDEEDSTCVEKSQTDQARVDKAQIDKTQANETQTDQTAGAELNYSVSAKEQRGASSEVFLQDTADGRWCETGSSNAFADIALNLPSGAALTSMRIWGFDQSNTNDLTVSLIERCTPNQQAGSVITSVISERSSFGSAGNFTSVTPIVLNSSIDNDACSYTLRTRYSTPGDINFCAGSVLRLQKIRLSYAP